ncbi:hypothetical protein SERLA73DRAFT_71399 [Serpula lacrymans var. lacrymans S7.3]|uniref:Uncharacterized protein n=2 Tax=Serpula lacrymans var. lacrymans TaxID=341189 RepID=F8PQL0_SERL3|nr:uncharacterized protein SERLADRAFT_435776 [Serpula lacrymans var. lacrymans S7.9]EGO02258.1 hypothetical protein SERLA73DRAFT_71399 [Serpula lacrymans var. lacrymans S7.3]EGO28003.1 hypothetical protein SERLADRAFT_435776 [Serpula lacrymans var. lacrymans S7.9]
MRHKSQLLSLSSRYKDEAAAYRAQALSTTSFYQECIEMVKGLSKAISILYGDVAQLRASVLTTSEKERQRLHSCLRPRSQRAEALPVHRLTDLSICSHGHSISGDCNTLVDVPPRSCRKLPPARSRSCPLIDEDIISSEYPPPFLTEFRKAKEQAPFLYGPLPRPAGFMLPSID